MLWLQATANAPRTLTIPKPPIVNSALPINVTGRSEEWQFLSRLWNWNIGNHLEDASVNRRTEWKERDESRWLLHKMSKV